MKTQSLWAMLLMLLGCAPLASAQVPQIISYQGRFNVQGTNFTGTAQFKFALVNASGSQTYWSHDGTGTAGGPPASAVSLVVSEGLFSVMLGDTNVGHMSAPIPATVFTNRDARLRIWCSAGASSFQQLSPDQPITSVGYAMRSASSDVALSLAPGVVTNAGTVTRIDTGPGLTGGPITISGRLSISNGGVSNSMLQNSAIIVTAGDGLIGGGTVPLGGATDLSLNLNHDSTLNGNGGSAALGLNTTNSNTWKAPQTFSTTITGSISGLAAGFTGPLAGDVTGTQTNTLITSLSASKISGLFKWQIVTNTTQQALPNTGYILTNSTSVTLMLPASPAVGDTLRVSAPGTGGWRITQNPNQSVLAGNFESLHIGLTWLPTKSPTTSWTALASSADGSQLVGVVNGGPIYVSTDAGASWTPRGVSTNWSSVASSADGMKLVAGVKGGFLYTSTDAGVSWTNHPPSANWYGVASSADGSKLVAVVNGGNIYTSTDSGLTWSNRPAAGSWLSIASSSDGTRLAAGRSSGPIFISADSGANWTQSAGVGGAWYSIASSADGTKLVAAFRGGQIYTSTDSGTNWSAGATSQNWYSVASSADGTKLAAVVNPGDIYTSTDSGLNWTSRQRIGNWYSIVSSADGTRLAAAANPGQIYGSPAPTVSPATKTTVGGNGYLVGGQGTALELQYIGNNQFIPLSSLGRIQAF